MGERNWYDRYRAARDYADEQVAMFARGEEISHWRHVTEYKPGEPEPPKETLTGAAWVAWAYELAARDARTLVQVKSQGWRLLVDECERLMQQYKELAS